MNKKNAALNGPLSCHRLRNRSHASTTIRTPCTRQRRIESPRDKEGERKPPWLKPRKIPRKEKFLFEDSCRLLLRTCTCTRIVRWVEEEERKTASRLWASISREEEPWLFPLLHPLLSRILASIILRSTTPEPSSENPSWNRTRIRSVHLPPEFPFGLALLLAGGAGLRPRR